jgi:hypothetical protein
MLSPRAVVAFLCCRSLLFYFSMVMMKQRTEALKQKQKQRAVCQLFSSFLDIPHG